MSGRERAQSSEGVGGVGAPRFGYALKRPLDVAIALLLILLLSPVFLFLAVAVRWSLGSPILFRQQRPGLDARLFTLVKFRTMTVVQEDASVAQSERERLTPFGSTLRRTSLDELPELWNVLRGDMSLVGPRPLLARYLPFYNEREALRHAVRPGITGWAQVNGRNLPGWPERLEMDVWYVEHVSLRLDIRILAKTIRSSLRSEGVVAVPNEAMLDLDAERGSEQL